MIYTFYSYKGGAGRTMALANMAELFYQAGLKVLMVDWDLEAPGLERFFQIDQERVLSNKGLIDMFLDYKEHVSKENNELNSELPFIDPKQYITEVYPDMISKGRLMLLSSGRRFGDYFSEYASTVQTFDWQDFYRNWEGELYFDWLRKRFLELADVVLIDSRTGVTEVGGVCTYQLSDTVLMFCTPNRQSVYGTSEMLKKFTDPLVESIRKDRKLDVIVVPSRVDKGDSNLVDQFQFEFSNSFSQLSKHGVDFWLLNIPYVPKYSFKELLAVNEKKRASAEEMISAYRELYSVMLKYGSSNPKLDLLLNNQANMTKFKTTMPTNYPSGGQVSQKRFALWGPSASGKTTYLLSLYIASRISETQWLVSLDSVNDEARALLDGMATNLMRGIFPPPTSPEKGEPDTYNFVLYHNNPRDTENNIISSTDSGITISFADVAGERYLLERSDSILWDYLAGTDGLICLLDPEDFNDQFQTLNRLGSILHQKFKAEYPDKLTNNRRYLPHYVAVCFTKMDRPAFAPFINEPENLIKDLEEKSGFNIKKVLEVDFLPSRISYHCISSLGLDNNLFANKSGEPKKIRPINIYDPLDKLLAS